MIVVQVTDMATKAAQRVLTLEQKLQISELAAEADHEKAVSADAEKVKQLRMLESQVCIKHDEFCIEHDGLCIYNAEFCIKNDQLSQLGVEGKAATVAEEEARVSDAAK